MSNAVNLVILGASGDLTHRLLLPGLGALLKAHPSRAVTLVGAAAEELGQQQWRDRVAAALTDGGCRTGLSDRCSPPPAMNWWTPPARPTCSGC